MKMKLMMIATTLLISSVAAQACEYQDGSKFTGKQCEFHCSSGGPLKKTKIGCEGMTGDPYNDPLYLEIQSVCGGDPEDSNCYTIP